MTAAGTSHMTAEAIEAVVLHAVSNINLARPSDQRLDVAPDATLFGPGSPLDSLGLVSLLIDIEEAFQNAGRELTLSDDRAMSQARSPFRSVPALVTYIHERLSTS